jgi:hypothetical protein
MKLILDGFFLFVSCKITGTDNAIKMFSEKNIFLQDFKNSQLDLILSVFLYLSGKQSGSGKKVWIRPDPDNKHWFYFLETKNGSDPESWPFIRQVIRH